MAKKEVPEKAKTAKPLPTIKAPPAKKGSGPKIKAIPQIDLAAAADELYNLRQERLKVEEQVTEMKKREEDLRAMFIEKLSGGLTGIAGKDCRVTMKEKVIYQAKDWKKIHAYIRKQAGKADDLLQRRLNDKAVAERVAAGAKIPGVEKFTAKRLSVTKV